VSGLILYATADGQNRIQRRTDAQTVWLTQLQMTELFQTSKQNIAKRLKAIFADGELHVDSIVNHCLTTAEKSSAVPVRGPYQGSRHSNIPDHMHKGQRLLSECAA
jgi:hypothetical protein